MKFAVISAALACIAFTNAVPTNPGSRLEVRKNDKDCKEFKKELKDFPATASAYCSSYIASTATVTLATTLNQTITVPSTLSVTATTTATVTASAPTATVTVPTVCGMRAYDNGVIFAYSVDPSIPTREECAARCLQDSNRCVSIAFGNFPTGETSCLLYSTPVASNFVPTPDSPYAFYDYTCPIFYPTPAAFVKRHPVASKEDKDTFDITTYPPADRSALCSCAIGTAPTTKVTVTATSTNAVTKVNTITATVSTVAETSVITPPPVTISAVVPRT